MTTTTKFWTWTQIWAKVKDEHDIDDSDDFISQSEAMGYANDAIDEAEAEICTIYEDYFLTRGTIALVSGTGEYAMPSTIYAHKIRGITYFNGSNVYPVKRIRDWKKFLHYRWARSESTSEDYRYFIINEVAGTPKILLSPVAYETGTYLEIWFTRQASRFESGADVCDIPEFHTFVMDYIDERIEAKRAAGSGRHQTALVKLNGSPDGTNVGSRQRMINTLTAMVPDGDNEIEADFSAYEEHN
jgi:hypothetical protein